MKFLRLTLFLFCLCFQAQATDWFVAKEATGLNNGTSWVNAWTNFPVVNLNSIFPGDTLWISGNQIGSSNVYTANLADTQMTGSPNSGLSGNPITIRPGPSSDTSHSGAVWILGYAFISKDYWKLDGRFDTNAITVSNSVLCTFDVSTNCNIHFYNTNQPNSPCVQMFGTGAKCYGVNVAGNISHDDAGINMIDVGSGRPIGNGSEIAYNWVQNVQGYALRGEIGNVVANTFGQISVHHNLVENINDNFMQYSSWVDFFKNVCRYHVDPDIGHPDCVQEVNAFSRIYDNIFYDFKGSRFYVEANNPLTHDILAYNNIWYSEYNWYGHTYTNSSGSAIVNNPGTGFDLTGHDANPGTPCNVSNIFYFNNTTYLAGNTNSGIVGAALIWSSGTTGNPRTGMNATNFWFLNNAVVGVPPLNNGCVLQLPTNTVFYNSTTGFQYDSTNGVHVDYNVVTRFTGKGQGMVFGDHGAPDLSNALTNMLEMAQLTAYQHNSNSVAVFAALPDNRQFHTIVNPTNNEILRCWPDKKFTADLWIGSGDTALVGTGTNLISAITNIAPECGNDIFGTPRDPNNFDVGAFQHDNNSYYVATTANASDSFTAQQVHSPATPWRTLNHAVSFTTNATPNILCGPGDYNEYVNVFLGGHDPNNRYTFRGYPENDWLFPVATRSIRVGANHVNISGFYVSKAVGANGAMIRIETGSILNGCDCVISNNTIADTVMLISSNCDFGVNYIHTTASYDRPDFNTAGFTPGTQVYMGSDSLYVYTNHGLTPTVLSNSVDGRTMFFQGSPFATDTTSNYWAAVIVGNSGAHNFAGLTTPAPGSGLPGATNIVIINNCFSNLIGDGVDLTKGDSNVLSGNIFTQLHGGVAMVVDSSDTILYRNIIISNRNVNWFTAPEVAGAPHPGNGTYYDWQGQGLGQFGPLDFQTNVIVRQNWVQDSDSQILQTDNGTNVDAFMFESNVVIASFGSGGTHFNDSTWRYNTFLKSSYNLESTTTIVAGAKTSEAGQLALTNFVSTNNAFIDCGSHFNTSQEAPMALTSLTNGIVTNNYSVFSETMLWTNTPNMAAPFVGGTFGSNNPVFVNIQNPLGPDGIPFTADDGLIPAPNSPLVKLGMQIGAYAGLPTNNPNANFNIVLPKPGYLDFTDTNYDTVWTGKRPDQRNGPIRAWYTPDAIGTNGQASTTALLDGSYSVDGLTATTSGVTNYTWTLAGVNTTNIVSTNSPYLNWTFTQPGTNTVTLQITASGRTNTYTRLYRLLAPVGDPSIITQPQNATVTAPATATFSVTATGTAPLTYQWYRNGVLISGATQSSYTTPGTVYPAQNGDTFYVAVSSAVGGPINSHVATLTVLCDITIITQPQNQTVLVGQSATFSVTATGGSGLHYAWTFNGAAVGTDQASYTRVNCQLADSGGIVRVTITDVGNTLQSGSATLTVNNPSAAVQPMGTWTIGTSTIGNNTR